MRLVAPMSSLLLCACATGAQSAGDAWASQGYSGFAGSVDSLVGPDAVDCGFFDLMKDLPSRKIRRQAEQCVNNAVRDGRNFKFGTLRLPMDSYATEVIARTADGKLWSIVFDVMIDGDAPQQWNRICQEVGIDRATMIITTEGCVEHSNGTLATG